MGCNGSDTASKTAISPTSFQSVQHSETYNLIVADIGEEQYLELRG